MEAIRGFVGMDLSCYSSPDETNISIFHHRLEKMLYGNVPTKRLFDIKSYRCFGWCDLKSGEECFNETLIQRATAFLWR